MALSEDVAAFLGHDQCTCASCGRNWSPNNYGYGDTRNRLTAGRWATEQDSVAELDRILTQIGAFNVYREVVGEYIQPRVGQDRKTPRIDRMLIPKTELIEAGWAHGPIGIECKRSGEKLGPAIAQCIDYSRAVWHHRDYRLALNWVFLWPAEKTHGALASILAQQRIGTAFTSPYELLKLASGEQVLASFNPDGQLRRVRAGDWGRKAGSR